MPDVSVWGVQYWKAGVTITVENHILVLVLGSGYPEPNAIIIYRIIIWISILLNYEKTLICSHYRNSKIKEVIGMKKLNFAVTGMKSNQVIDLIINYRFLFPHLLNKTGTKRQAKPKSIPPASIKLPPE